MFIYYLSDKIVRILAICLIGIIYDIKSLISYFFWSNYKKNINYDRWKRKQFNESYKDMVISFWKD